jgi:hypothetical protein
MYIYNFLLRMTDTVISQNIDLSSWDILYNNAHVLEILGSEMSSGRRANPALLPYLHVR